MDDRGLNAYDWSNRVAAVMGGRAGGRGTTSVGNGTEPEKVDEALLVATKYLERFGFR